MIGVCMRWFGGHIHPLRDELVNRGSFTRVVIDPSIGMLPVSCEQLLSLAGLFLLSSVRIIIYFCFLYHLQALPTNLIPFDIRY